MVTVKRTSTIAWQGRKMLTEHTPMSISGAIITAAFKGASLIFELSAVNLDDDESDNVGKFSLNATATETAAWPLGEGELDIRFSFPSGEILSDTLLVKVVRNITPL